MRGRLRISPGLRCPSAAFVFGIQPPAGLKSTPRDSARWQIELFFRWIKQHLRIRSFYGTSANAVKTQVWIAITVYVLVAILKNSLA